MNAPSANSKPRILIISMGGTIERQGRTRLDLGRYQDNGAFVEISETLRRLPELNQFGEVTAMARKRVSSSEIGLSDLLSLSAVVDSISPADADGIVITHGTDTLEESAFFLHMTLKTELPVVMVGAMRPPSGLSADGDLNLVNAVLVAGDRRSRGLGVLVVSDNRVYSARSSIKGSTFASSNFNASAFGPLGFVEAAEPVRYFQSPSRPHTVDTEFDLAGVSELPKVAVVGSYLDSEGEAIDVALERKFSGLVLACAGSTGITPGELRALERAVSAGIAVCLTPRSGDGGRSILGDAERNLGCVAADHLSPWTARILLSLALALTNQPTELQRIFDTY